jgi:hypothetical protein
MVRGLLTLSLEISEVSRVPGREVWNSWNAKLPGARCLSKKKIRSTQKYCAPGF